MIDICQREGCERPARWSATLIVPLAGVEFEQQIPFTAEFQRIGFCGVHATPDLIPEFVALSRDQVDEMRRTAGDRPLDYDRALMSFRRIGARADIQHHPMVDA